MSYSQVLTAEDHASNDACAASSSAPSMAQANAAPVSAARSLFSPLFPTRPPQANGAPAQAAPSAPVPLLPAPPPPASSARNGIALDVSGRRRSRARAASLSSNAWGLGGALPALRTPGADLTPLSNEQDVYVLEDLTERDDEEDEDERERSDATVRPPHTGSSHSKTSGNGSARLASIDLQPAPPRRPEDEESSDDDEEDARAAGRGGEDLEMGLLRADDKEGERRESTERNRLLPASHKGRNGSASLGMPLSPSALANGIGIGSAGVYAPHTPTTYGTLPTHFEHVSRPEAGWMWTSAAAVVALTLVALLISYDVIDWPGDGIGNV